MEVKWLNVEEKWETIPAGSSNTNGKEAKHGLEEFLKENGVGGSAYEKLVEEGVETVQALFLLSQQDISSMSSLSIGHKRVIIQILEQGKKAKSKSDPLFSKLKDKGIGDELIPAILAALREKGGVTTAEQLEQLEQEDVDELGLAVLPRKALKGILKQRKGEEGVGLAVKEAGTIKEAMDACVRARLIRPGQDISALDESGRPPIVRAATEGDVDKLQLLVAAGAPIDAEDKHGCTAVHWAAANGRVTCLEYLADQGASLSHTCNHGTTPAWNAAFHGRHHILEILADRGADLKTSPAKGKFAGKTPYIIAEEKGHPEEARLIEQRTRDY